MLLLAISILPVIIILIYIYRRDKYEKEPIGLLIKSFFGGVLSAVLTVLLLMVLLPVIPKPTDVFLLSIFEAFVEAAIPEEFFKFLILYLIIWRHKAFNEMFDGIVYAVFVSLGFACIENIFYVFSNGVLVGLLRAVLSVPGHALFGVIMGYYLSLARFNPEQKNLYIIKSLFFSTLAHGIFNFLLFYTSKNAENNMLIALTAFVVFFIFVFILWRIGFRKLKKHSEASAFKNLTTIEVPVSEIDTNNEKDQ